MNRNDRRRDRRASAHEADASWREFYVEPDFEMDWRSGRVTPALPGPVREMPFVVDGKLQRLCKITLGGKPLPSAANEVAWAMASSLLDNQRDDPEQPTEVQFSIVDLREPEAFFSDHEALEGVLWLARAPMFADCAVSMKKLQPFVPTFGLIKGLRHLRVRDCLDFLGHASSNAGLRLALTT